MPSLVMVFKLGVVAAGCKSFLGEARRRWSEEEKRAVVAETYVEGETVNGVARRHKINPNMLFSWRKHTARRFERAAPASSSISFTPVVIAPPEPSPPPSPTVAVAAPLIELEFGSGIQLRNLWGCRSGFGGGGDKGDAAAMIPISSGVRVWIATGHTDMRRGMQGLALQVQEGLKRKSPRRRSLRFFAAQRRFDKNPLA